MAMVIQYFLKNAPILPKRAMPASFHSEPGCAQAMAAGAHPGWMTYFGRRPYAWALERTASGVSSKG